MFFFILSPCILKAVFYAYLSSSELFQYLFLRAAVELSKDAFPALIRRHPGHAKKTRSPLQGIRGLSTQILNGFRPLSLAMTGSEFLFNSCNKLYLQPPKILKAPPNVHQWGYSSTTNKRAAEGYDRFLGWKNCEAIGNREDAVPEGINPFPRPLHRLAVLPLQGGTAGTRALVT